MGQFTHFHGMLEFSHPMKPDELVLIERIIEAGQRGQCEGLITGDGLKPGYADLHISDDKRGLIYCSEKTYDMVGGVNFIIVNARARIPGFGLKGMLAADTEFAPYHWFVKIGQDGLAYQEATTADEFLAVRRKLYPNGYKGYGLVDPKDKAERDKSNFYVDREHAQYSAGPWENNVNLTMSPAGLEVMVYEATSEYQITTTAKLAISEAREMARWLCEAADHFEVTQAGKLTSAPENADPRPAELFEDAIHLISQLEDSWRKGKRLEAGAELREVITEIMGRPQSEDELSKRAPRRPVDQRQVKKAEPT